jgi:hypothetical protein
MRGVCASTKYCKRHLHHGHRRVAPLHRQIVEAQVARAALQRGEAARAVRQHCLRVAGIGQVRGWVGGRRGAASIGHGQHIGEDAARFHSIAVVVVGNQRRAGHRDLAALHMPGDVLGAQPQFGVGAMPRLAHRAERQRHRHGDQPQREQPGVEGGEPQSRAGEHAQARSA